MVSISKNETAGEREEAATEKVRSANPSSMACGKFHCHLLSWKLIRCRRSSLGIDEISLGLSDERVENLLIQSILY